MRGLDGKNYPSDCANIAGVLRVFMTVPLPKAEPLILWLAEQGKRILDETNDLELMTERQADIYKTRNTTFSQNENMDYLIPSAKIANLNTKRLCHGKNDENHCYQ